MVKGISKICIENVKGFSNWIFDEHLIPNRLHIFVAPNGFGKSSFAIAFKSLNENRINLNEKCFHKCNPQNMPQLELTYSDGMVNFIYAATATENSISSEFDVYVINSPLKPKATTQNHGRYTTAIVSMKIEPIILVNTIPDRKIFDYKISEMWELANIRRSYWKNIKDIVSNIKVMIFCDEKIDWQKLKLKKVETHIKQLIKIVAESPENMCDFSQDTISTIKENHDLADAITVIQTIIPQNTFLESFFILLQIQHLRNKNKKLYNETIKWYRYCAEKVFYEELIKSLNSSWNLISPRESRGKLILEFPDAEYLSNGQRDFLSFVVQLYSSKKHLKKDKCILIVDEIFDYLDDANLVAFQYYIAKFVHEFKQNGKEIYPILMTHLDPCLFSHFRLKKTCIHHLDNRSFSDNLHLKNLIMKRDDPSIKYFVDHYLFHYCPDSCHKTDEFSALQLKKNLAETKTFHPLMVEEVRKYIHNQEADPFAICIALRVKIEKWVYEHLSTDCLKKEFIETHETQKKLIFADNNGVRIPEIFYLLGIIYNSPLHTTFENIDVLGKRLLRNLTNITIKNMISTLFKELR